MSQILIDKGRLLVDFDQDTRNFIDAAGLNNDANLNVDGLYTVEQARMAVHFLISGLKGIQIWNKCLAFYPALGGKSSIGSLNLINPSLNPLINLGGSYPNISYNNKGIVGCGDTALDITSLSNNYSFCSYNIVDGATNYLVGLGNSDNSLWLYQTDRIRFSSSAGVVVTGNRTGGIVANLSTTSSNIYCTHNDLVKFPSGLNFIGNKIVRIGALTDSGLHSPTSNQNCVGVFSLLTAIEQKQLRNLLEDVNVIVNRSVR